MTLIQRSKTTNNWTAVASIGGKRVWHNTQTPNRKKAERRAKVYFDALRDGCVEAADMLANRRGGTIPTIAAVVNYYMMEATCRRATAVENANCLLLILNELYNGDVTKRKSSILTGKVISDWEKLRHSQVSGVKAMHSAKRTIFSTVRKAKSVFTKRMQQRYLDAAMHIDVKSFLARSVENGPSVRYKAPKDKSLAPRTFKASEKLRREDPQAFICLLLAMQAGLRKSEIANARLSWLEDHVIHVQPDGEYDTKNSHEREVPVNGDTYKTLIELLGEKMSSDYAKHSDEYILSGNKTERTDLVFRRLNKWLADLGWTHSDKRTHELRKWYGSQVSKLGGLHAAQHLLGHMDYSTTDRYYADPGANVVLKSTG
jgi:integrase